MCPTLKGLVQNSASSYASAYCALSLCRAKHLASLLRKKFCALGKVRVEHKTQTNKATQSLTPNGNKTHAVHYKSVTVEWATPMWLFLLLKKTFPGGFTLDPCCTDFNAKCQKYFTLIQDGLLQSWAKEIVFMNPPYGRAIWHWMRKAYLSALKDGATVVCLVPARTDTKWWHDFALQGNNQIIFLKGRLKFGDAKNSAPFPSALIVMRPPGAAHFEEGYLSNLINDAKCRQRKHTIDSSRAA